MNLETIFNQLIHGELSQVFVADMTETNGEVPEAKKQELISHISMALTVLHKRFKIKEGRVTLELIEGKEQYVLDKAFAESNTDSSEPVKYIKDPMFPFTNDLLKVERVLDDKNCELYLNVLGQPDSIHMPNYNTLLVPASLETVSLSVAYRADHKPLEGNILFYPPAYIPIDLPPVYLEPLLLFVASRVHNPIGMDQSFHQGNNYAALYEKACQQIEASDYQVVMDSPNEKFYARGWV